MKTIFVPTIQSTGTWFLLNLLENHSFVSYCSTWTSFNEDDIVEIAVIQRHFGEDHPGGPELKAYGDDNLEEMLSKSDKIVIPVRDPLLSLVTSNIRGPELDHHRFIVNGFVRLVEICEKHNVFLLPVDLYAHRSPLERYSVLRSLFKFLEMPLEPYLAIFAMEWPVVNTVGDRLGKDGKNMYFSRDISGLSNMLGEDYNYLISKKDILKPFLEKIGYQELLWA